MPQRGENARIENCKVHDVAEAPQKHKNKKQKTKNKKKKEKEECVAKVREGKYPYTKRPPIPSSCMISLTPTSLIKYTN